MRSFSEAVSSASITQEDTAFIDKFSLKIKLGELDLSSITVNEGEDEEGEKNRAFALFISALGRPDRREPDRYPELRYDSLLPDSTTNQVKGWMFSSRNIENIEVVRNSYDLRVSSIIYKNLLKEELCPLPLFAGTATCYKADKPVTLEFDFNLARYFHYNAPYRRLCKAEDRESRVGSRVAAYSRDLPYFDRDESPSAGEYSYDGQSNWFHQSGALVWRTVRRRLRDYIETVEGAVEQEIERATRIVPHVQVDSFLEVENQMTDKYDLSYCEVAWEFSSDNPRQLVSELLPLAEGYRTAGASSRDYPVYIGTGDRECGANKSLNIDLTKGCTLAIYAKTNRRVRVEVRYRLKQLMPEGFGGRIADQYSGIAYKFDKLRVDAEEKVNTFLSYVRDSQYMVVSPSSVSVVQLVFDVLEHCGIENRELAEDLLYELSSNGCIHIPRGGSSVKRKILRNMSSRVPKMIRRKNEHHPYRPMPAYQWAVQQLSQSTLWEDIVATPSVTRRRRRPRDWSA